MHKKRLIDELRTPISLLCCGAAFKFRSISSRDSIGQHARQQERTGSTLAPVPQCPALASERTDVSAKPKTTEAAPAAEPIAGKTIEVTAPAITADAPKAAAEAMGATQASVKQGMEKAMKTAEEFVAFSQGNVEALMKSGQIWVTGVQDLSKHVAAAAQASMEEGLSTFKAMTSVKSLKEAFDLQAAFARNALEKTVSESSKLTDASFKLTEQALAPITARVTVAVEKFSKTA
ncbi:MAG TPA: phasin family protein [Rhodopila sp.]|uniref:phasin family protein n=1 Tax=Rhodopila sp. TaxID=2480087 RepID=UPI002C56DC07|nr:phasin family protein [Rhodopila sp.]HVY16093.1 phasin family protein [Rhodopila sp.]